MSNGSTLSVIENVLSTCYSNGKEIRMEKQTKQREVFREDTASGQPLAEKSKKVLNAARKLHMYICGGAPNMRLRKPQIEQNIEMLRQALDELESRLENEKLNTEPRRKLTFF